MWVCEGCAKLEGWAYLFGVSEGPCELCGVTKLCADIRPRTVAKSQGKAMSNDPHGQSNQPLPEANNPHPAIYDLVIADLRARDAYGQAKYGQRLKPHNGRDTLQDVYEEALDLVVYLRTLKYEQQTVHKVAQSVKDNCISRIKRMALMYSPDSQAGRIFEAVILELENGDAHGDGFSGGSLNTNL